MTLKSLFLLLSISSLGIQAQAQSLPEVDKAYQDLKVCELNAFAPTTDSLYQKAKSMADSRLNEDGSVVLDFEKGYLEQMMFGNLLNMLYAHTQDARYKKASNWIHHYLVMSYPRNKKTTAQNVFIYNEKVPNQMKIEGLYWAVVYFAGWVSTFDVRNTQAWSDIADQFMLLNTQTYNAVTGVNYPLWTSDVENDDTDGIVQEGVFKGCLPVYSAISMARMFAAAVDVLAVIPKEQPDRAPLSILVKQIADGLQHWKDEASHMWARSLVYSAGNLGEMDAEATEMITATYLKALRLDMLKDADFKAFALATFDAAKARGCSQLLQAEYDAFQKSRTPVKKPTAKAPVRRTTPVKR